MVWVHLCVYLVLYGLFVGAMLTRVELTATTLLRLDFAVSFLLMVAVCRFSLPVLLGEAESGE